MNKHLLLAVFSLFFFGISNAQTTANQSGIAIQGIARDANNTARANQNIQLSLAFYYINASGQEQEIINLNNSVTTDSFGVFSLTLDTNVNNNPVFANHESYLRIKDGNGTTISDEKLKTVPYSISAGNGVPTGSIMAFMGATIPKGWVLCDGRTLTNVAGSEELRALVGNNVPNLQGYFLRGAGSNGFTEKTTSVGVAYYDTNLSHGHAVNIDTSSDGAYNPTNEAYNRLLQFTGNYTVNNPDNTSFGREPDLGGSSVLNIPAHTHKVSGNTLTSGSNESAPVHFGVNYMIKL